MCVDGLRSNPRYFGSQHAGSLERADSALVAKTRAAASKRQSERRVAVDRAAARLR